jgi:hypothetical protein
MFGPNHYVPILRWKQAERFALKSLQPSDRIRITPLIELTPTLLKTRKRGEIQQTPDPAQSAGARGKETAGSLRIFSLFLGSSLR